MTLLYYDPRFLDHHTGDHPECPGRLQQIVSQLAANGLDRRCCQPEWEPIRRTQLLGVHFEEQIAHLEGIAQQGGGQADSVTVVSEVSVDIAKLAAGAVCNAVGRVLKGEDSKALCLVRPPGHHALAERAMGFCLFNNIALGARAALDQGVERVLIVDWDVHHGNGTQAIFYNDPRVAFFSAHRWPFYPGTGAEDETGTGDGLGATRNVPVEFGTSRKVYQELVRRELEDFAARIKPELVLISAGFDAHRSDPIGSLGLEVEDFIWLSQLTLEIAETYAAGRLVSTLEGGYNPTALAESVAVHLEALLAADP
ncbi:MAG: histone deacetylase [Planctomycetes bacterium]|nr:histone deacetylase [Planctomycetota bacterium]